MPEQAFKNASDLMRDIQDVKISGYKAFNAGILPLKSGGYLFASRYRGESFLDSTYRRHIKKENVKGILLGRLDENFSETNDPKTFFGSGEFIESREVEYLDPRLIFIKNEIFMIYCRQNNQSSRKRSSAILHLAKIQEVKGRFEVISDVPLEFEKPSEIQEFYEKGLVQKGFEKNWMPFSKDGGLFFVYLMDPEHVILKADIETGKCCIESRSKSPFPVLISNARGSTPAVYDDELGEWIAFFHYLMPAKRSFSKKKAHAYFFAGYTFDNAFNMQRKSKGAIIGKGAYDNFRKILFPTSLVRDGGDYLVFFGNDDEKNQVARISRQALIDSMEAHE